MATTKPLTTETIALTEKKMDMTLDDIIKMSKKPTTKVRSAPRLNIKSQGFLNGYASRRNTMVQHFMDSRSSIRQGVLAQRRSNFRGNQFQLTTNVARNAAALPVRGMMVNRHKPRGARAPVQRKAADGGFGVKDKMMLLKHRPQTLDALFANMKEQRMRFSAQQQSTQPNSRQTSRRHRSRQQQQQQQRVGRGGVVGRGSTYYVRYGNSAK